MENEEKWMKKEKIFENDEESSTLQMQTDRGRERQDEHSVIQGDKEKIRIQKRTFLVKTWDFLGILLNKKNSNFGAFLGN